MGSSAHPWHGVSRNRFGHRAVAVRRATQSEPAGLRTEHHSAECLARLRVRRTLPRPHQQPAQHDVAGLPVGCRSAEDCGQRDGHRQEPNNEERDRVAV